MERGGGSRSFSQLPAAFRPGRYTPLHDIIKKKNFVVFYNTLWSMVNNNNDCVKIF